jgi:hypothetical protein
VKQAQPAGLLEAEGSGTLLNLQDGGATLGESIAAGDLTLAR